MTLAFLLLLGAQVPHLRLQVAIDPAAGQIQGTAVWEGVPESIQVELFRDVVLLAPDAQEVDAREPHRRAWKVPGNAVLRFRGKIQDLPEEEGTLTFVRGDRTEGLIHAENVSLWGTTGWYPLIPGVETFTAEVEISLPSGYTPVLSGNLPIEVEETGTGVRYRYRTPFPVQDLALVANRFFVYEREHSGVRLRVLLLKENPELASVFLDALVGYLDRYQELLGPFPFDHFDVVENTFTTGYGFAGFTLLGSAVLQMGRRILQPGYLDHEFVHNWFGNALYTPRDGENWAEGLTSYFANYLNRERAGDDEARKYRFGLMVRFSARVDPARAYPLRHFRGKEEEFDNDIGYGKAAMFFHLLRRLAGDEAFFNIIRDMVHQRLGTVVRWDDFRHFFQMTLRDSLEWLFEEWLDRKDLPRFRLRLQSHRPSRGAYLLEGAIVQEGEVYHLSIPLVVRLADGSVERLNVWTMTRATPFRLTLRAPALRVDLDPDFHIFRRIPERSLPPTFQTALRRGGLTVVAPEPPGPFETLLERLREMKDIRIVRGFPERLPGGNVLVLSLGRPTLVPPRWWEFFPGARWEGDRLTILGRAIQGESTSAMAWIRRPDDVRRFLGVFWAESWNALQRAQYLPYYGWDSAIVFENGFPAARTLPMQVPEWSVYLPPIQEAIPIPSLTSYVRELSDSRWKGRNATAPEYRRIAELAAGWLEEVGLEPCFFLGDWLQEFRFRIKAPVSSTPTPAVPHSGSPEGEVRWERVVMMETPDPEAIRAVGAPTLLVTRASAWESLEPQLGLLQEAGAVALVLLYRTPEEVPPSLQMATTWPGNLWQPRAISPEIQWARAQARLEGKRLPIPVWLVSEEDFSDAWLRGRAQLAFDFRSFRSWNVLGCLPGDPARLVVASAHLDALGEHGGKRFSGALDNASGVAALLGAARFLAALRAGLRSRGRATLVFAFFGAEEWGLRGARAFLRMLPEGTEVVWNLNVDTVAQVGVEKAFLIGGTRDPETATVLQRVAEEMEIPLEGGLDRYALAGSDHFAFLEAGIPALDIFWADYRLVDSPEDRPSLISDASLERLARFLGRVLSAAWLSGARPGAW